MKPPLKILILEDSPDDVNLIERELMRGNINFTSVVVKRKHEFENRLREFRPDVIPSTVRIKAIKVNEGVGIVMQNITDLRNAIEELAPAVGTGPHLFIQPCQARIVPLLMFAVVLIVLRFGKRIPVDVGPLWRSFKIR